MATTMRKFKPRKKIPKDKLIKMLEDGYTLSEIGNEFGVATSYISEYLKMLKIDLNDFKGRRTKIERRKQEKSKQRVSFFDEFYNQIKNEVS